MTTDKVKNDCKAIKGSAKDAGNFFEAANCELGIPVKISCSFPLRNWGDFLDGELRCISPIRRRSERLSAMPLTPPLQIRMVPFLRWKFYPDTSLKVSENAVMWRKQDLRFWVWRTTSIGSTSYRREESSKCRWVAMRSASFRDKKLTQSASLDSLTKSYWMIHCLICIVQRRQNTTLWQQNVN